MAAERLIIEYHSGDINIDDFINSRKILSRDREFSPDFDIIFDFRDANMMVDQAGIRKFVDFFKGYNSLIGNRKSAYITSKPNQVAITTIFSMEIEEVSVNPMTFSTLKAAADWIENKSIDEQSLSDILQELKAHTVNVYQS